MNALRDIMLDKSRFLCGVELVTSRGTLAEAKAIKTREMATDLVSFPKVDWVSITDNAGGNPNLSPIAIGKYILYAGKEVMIHLSCKDFNRNGLESQAWQLASEGFQNILALSGDYPSNGFNGDARPVFDIDSVGLLTMLSQMNKGLDVRSAKPQSPPKTLLATTFFPGAVASNFKLHENELLPQLLKLEQKLAAGAQFIIAQIGYDARKSSELKTWLDNHGHRDTPLIGNVFLLNPRVAAVFHSGKIPGVNLSDELFQRCQRYASSPDKGTAFFTELAAKQIAVFRGLGFRGAYIGCVDDLRQVEKILDLADAFSKNDWRSFIPELSFPRPNEFYLYDQDPVTRLANPGKFSPQYNLSRRQRPRPKSITLNYRLSKLVHHLAFTPGTALFNLARKLYTPPASNPKKSRPPLPLHILEHASKSLLFNCKNCGDCSLPDTTFLCPESACAKNQRNGPCGGTRDGLCEVRDLPCIWATAYDRRKFEGTEKNLLAHAPVLQNQALRNSSSWQNLFLNRDHNARPPDPPSVPQTKKPNPLPKETTSCTPNPSASSAN